MSGNVWEWCGDWHDPEYFAKSPERDPTGPERSNERGCRGGSWSTPLLTAGKLLERARQSGSHRREAWTFHVPRMTVTARGAFAPTYRFNNLGFRVARGHP